MRAVLEADEAEIQDGYSIHKEEFVFSLSGTMGNLSIDVLRQPALRQNRTFIGAFARQAF